MSTDLNKLFNSMNRGDVLAIKDQLFPRRAAATREPSSFAPAEGSSPAADTGTAGVGTSSEIQRLNGLVAHYRRKDGEHERLVGKLLKLLNEDDLDGARDLVKDEYDSIHGPRE